MGINEQRAESRQYNWPENLRSELDQRRIDFIKADLKVCFTFAGVVATELKIGDREANERAIALAEKATKLSVVSSPIPCRSLILTADQVRDFKAELHRLRERLDGLQH